MRERRVRRRVGDVVCGNEDRLQRRDRTSLRRGNPLLQLAHLVGERWLVPHRRRHPAEQRRHLGTGLREPEDVVDEQQHVFSFDVAEILGHRQRRETNTETPPCCCACRRIISWMITVFPTPAPPNIPILPPCT